MHVPHRLEHGARSAVARSCLPGAEQVKCVFAYHEVVEAPEEVSDAYDGRRCDVFYQGDLSPDFYAWIFPHGATASIGVGSGHKGGHHRCASLTSTPLKDVI